MNENLINLSFSRKHNRALLKSSYLLGNLFLLEFLSAISRGKQHKHTSGNEKSPRVQTEREKTWREQLSVGRQQPTGEAVLVGFLVRVIGRAHCYSETGLQHAQPITISAILRPTFW